MRVDAHMTRLVAEARRRSASATNFRLAARDQDSSWQVYENLLPESTALIRAQHRGNSPARVNLLIPEVGRGSLFAGVRTALSFACQLANALGRPLRAITYGGPPARPSSASWFDNLARNELGFQGPGVELMSVWDRDPVAHSGLDYWIATYWTTAHSLDVACRAGYLDRRSVIYLVQDYEPHFYAGSTRSAIAQSTYHAGFHLVVNSRPLRRYLERREGLAIPPGLVFRPDLDVERLAEVAARRELRETPVIGFYGRPSKPRNSFELGVSALRSAERDLRNDGLKVVLFSIGERHKPVQVGDLVLRSKGKVPWAKYFEILARTDIVLSLQQTPHPSHPPLDSVASGGLAVTNEFEDTRGALSPRLLAASNHPDALGATLASAVRRTISSESPGAFDEAFVTSLGTPLDKVVRNTLEVLD